MEEMKMNKSDLVNSVVELSAEDNKLSKAEVTRVVDLIEEAIVGALKSGDKVQLVGFLTVEPTARSARKGFNPITHEEIEIAPKMGVKVSAGKRLKDSVKELNIADFAKK